jgi:hypothetical protein
MQYSDEIAPLVSLGITRFFFCNLSAVRFSKEHQKQVRTVFRKVVFSRVPETGQRTECEPPVTPNVQNHLEPAVV